MSTTSDWKPTACILCECNCGIEVQLGGEDGRELVRFRGDKRHPASQGYACEKPHRLNYYQNAAGRLLTPKRRRADGSFESIDWNTAIDEVVHRLASVRDEHGGKAIFYYGGGGQGNHLCGAYSTATRRALGSRYRSSALAQEKTGEFWVNDRMLGNSTRADFEHCDVALFLGKNPWHSHGIPRARVTLKEIAKDPARTMIVVDPRRTKTAELADIHLQLRPGTDAWLLAALVAIVLEEQLVDGEFVAAHTVGLDTVSEVLGQVDVARYAGICDVPEALLREAARVIGRAEHVASFEDLGLQMNRHSTLASYLHKLLVFATGNFGKPGTHYIPSPLLNIASGKCKHRSPVTDARIVGGMVPCNSIADEILTDHPDRFRAMIVEGANPAHSLAESPRMREALSSLDTLVVIDVAMTETARLADIVLPATTQFEKVEATFFNFEFPQNTFHLRQPILPAPALSEGPLPEAEIHARIVEGLGMHEGVPLAELRAAAAEGLPTYAGLFAKHVAFHPKRAAYAATILYRTLGPALPEGLDSAAVVLGLALQFALKEPRALAAAGIPGSGPAAGVALFAKLLASPSGLVFAVGEWDDVRGRIGTASGKVELALDDLLDEAVRLAEGPAPAAEDFPFVLSAGERRSFTANTIIRDGAWRKKDPAGALRMSPDDAERLALSDGARVRVRTRRGATEAVLEISETMRAGHISLPNGMGLEDEAAAPNELTETGARDPYVGTPWHKHVPAMVEAVI